MSRITPQIVADAGVPDGCDRMLRAMAADPILVETAKDVRLARLPARNREIL